MLNLAEGFVSCGSRVGIGEMEGSTSFSGLFHKVLRPLFAETLKEEKMGSMFEK
jgi:hypothetical protein